MALDAPQNDDFIVTKSNIPFMSLFIDLWNLQQRIKALKSHDCFVVLTQNEIILGRLVHITPNYQTILSNFPSAPASSIITRQDYVGERRLQCYLTKIKHY